MNRQSCIGRTVHAVGRAAVLLVACSAAAQISWTVQLGPPQTATVPNGGVTVSVPTTVGNNINSSPDMSGRRPQETAHVQLLVVGPNSFRCTAAGTLTGSFSPPVIFPVGFQVVYPPAPSVIIGGKRVPAPKSLGTAQYSVRAYLNVDPKLSAPTASASFDLPIGGSPGCWSGSH